MTNKEKRFKAVLSDSHFGTEKDEWIAYSLSYRGTSYEFQCTENDAVSSSYEREDFQTIADELTLYRTSRMLKRVLDEKIYQFTTYAIETHRIRQRPLGLISHLLNCALASYIHRYHDTPTKDDLWQWLFKEPNCLIKVGFYVNEQGELLKIKDNQILTLETFTRKFNAKIGTKSLAYQEELEDKQFKAEWGITKRPRGRPRKSPWKKDV